MNKITVKNLIKFRRKSDGPRLTLLNNLRKEKIKTGDDSGGDYWISCSSAIVNAFKTGKTELLQLKISEIQEMILTTEFDKTKKRFQKNIDVLVDFQDFDLLGIKPNSEIKFLTQQKDKALLKIGGLSIEASIVFNFSENGSDEIGAIWFVTQLDGFEKNELGMFSEVIFKYLNEHFSNQFYINSTFCIAVDVFKGSSVRYSDLESGMIPSLLEETIGEINKY